MKKPTLKEKINQKIDSFVDKAIDKMVDPTLEQLDKKSSKKAYVDQDFEKHKTCLALSYFFFFVPLFWAKESEYKDFYFRQGLLLFASSLVFAVVSFLLSLISIALGWVVAILSFSIVLFAMIFGLVKTCQGYIKVKLPIIGKILQ